MPSTYDIRLIQAGNIIEIIEYEKMILMSENENKNENKLRLKIDESKLEIDDVKQKKNREYVKYKARNDVRRLINANVYQWKDEKGDVFLPVFLTLTFAQNIKDLLLANKEFRKFIKRLGNQLAHDQAYVKYVAVPEFQKRGAVHYHLVMFNLPYIKARVIEKIWTHGFIKINAIDEVDNVGAYVCKYMTKEDDQDKLKGQKCYFTSRSINKPEEIKTLSDSKTGRKIKEMLNDLSEYKKYVTEQDSEYYGLIRYTQYNTLKKLIPEGVLV